MRFSKAVAYCVCIGALTGCGAKEPSANDFNVILISIDTLRPDHLGCYGYERPTSPAIDSFREEAVLFERAISHAPSTLHSHASILSSLLPFHHQASWDARTRMPDEVVSIAEVLRQSGYATAAITGGGQMDKLFGLDQGFSSYDHTGSQSFADTAARAAAWLDAKRQSEDTTPFFLFLHSYETHHPYSPEAKYLDLFDEPNYDGPIPDSIQVDLLREINQKDREIDQADLDHIVATYDAEIRSMDDGFASLVSYLRNAGMYDDSLIVFTSDHGEEFGEHGRVGWHSHSLFDELLHVPLIVKYPDGHFAGSTVEGQTRSIDIAPTIAAVVGVEVPPAFLGIDLTELASGSSSDLPAVSRMDRKATRDIASVRTPSWKLYRGRLFDLEADPTEQWDTAMNHPKRIAELRAVLDTAIKARPRMTAPQVAPTGKTLDDLKALGYLQ
ncbi:MAG: sulfatase-like hydrolase/transferase [Acidobacteriota bacterium]|nr:sulfatase-like hydrolase/transferase [Acidobacteriota bacterium]